jgi:PTH2 family peptidyl-tRNA hydrolase
MDSELIDDDGRIRIWVNSNSGMSRGKYAAAAVHAALTAAGVHPGVPVIVLGGHRDHIERMSTVIRDAGRTEVEPGTVTAGTDYVFEAAQKPTDDEREALTRALRGIVDEGIDERDAVDAILAAGFRRRASPEPSAEAYWGELVALRDRIEEARTAWWSATEQGDNGLIYTDRIADAMDDIWSAIGHADWEPYAPEPQTEPTDAQVVAALRKYETPDGAIWRYNAFEDMRAALRAALNTKEEGHD